MQFLKKFQLGVCSQSSSYDYAQIINIFRLNFWTNLLHAFQSDIFLFTFKKNWTIFL